MYALALHSFVIAVIGAHCSGYAKWRLETMVVRIKLAVGRDAQPQCILYLLGIVQEAVCSLAKAILKYQRAVKH